MGLRTIFGLKTNFREGFMPQLRKSKNLVKIRVNSWRNLHQACKQHLSLEPSNFVSFKDANSITIIVPKIINPKPVLSKVEGSKIDYNLTLDRGLLPSLGVYYSG